MSSANNIRIPEEVRSLLNKMQSGQVIEYCPELVDGDNLSVFITLKVNSFLPVWASLTDAPTFDGNSVMNLASWLNQPGLPTLAQYESMLARHAGANRNLNAVEAFQIAVYIALKTRRYDGSGSTISVPEARRVLFPPITTDPGFSTLSASGHSFNVTVAWHQYLSRPYDKRVYIGNPNGAACQIGFTGAGTATVEGSAVVNISFQGASCYVNGTQVSLPLKWWINHNGDVIPSSQHDLELGRQTWSSGGTAYLDISGYTLISEPTAAFPTVAGRVTGGFLSAIPFDGTPAQPGSYASVNFVLHEGQLMLERYDSGVIDAAPEWCDWWTDDVLVDVPTADTSPTLEVRQPTVTLINWAGVPTPAIVPTLYTDAVPIRVMTDINVADLFVRVAAVVDGPDLIDITGDVYTEYQSAAISATGLFDSYMVDCHCRTVFMVVREIASAILLEENAAPFLSDDVFQDQSYLDVPLVLSADGETLVSPNAMSVADKTELALFIVALDRKIQASLALRAIDFSSGDPLGAIRAVRQDIWYKLNATLTLPDVDKQALIRLVTDYDELDSSLEDALNSALSSGCKSASEVASWISVFAPQYALTFSDVRHATQYAIFESASVYSGVPHPLTQYFNMGDKDPSYYGTWFTRASAALLKGASVDTAYTELDDGTLALDPPVYSVQVRCSPTQPEVATLSGGTFCVPFRSSVATITRNDFGYILRWYARFSGGTDDVLAQCIADAHDEFVRVANLAYSIYAGVTDGEYFHATWDPAQYKPTEVKSVQLMNVIIAAAVGTGVGLSTATPGYKQQLNKRRVAISSLIGGVSASVLGAYESITNTDALQNVATNVDDAVSTLHVPFSISNTGQFDTNVSDDAFRYAAQFIYWFIRGGAWAPFSGNDYADPVAPGFIVDGVLDCKYYYTGERSPDYSTLLFTVAIAGTAAYSAYFRHRFQPVRMKTFLPGRVASAGIGFIAGAVHTLASKTASYFTAEQEQVIPTMAEIQGAIDRLRDQLIDAIEQSVKDDNRVYYM